MGLIGLTKMTPKLIMCGKHAKIYKSGPYYRVVSNYSGMKLCTVRDILYALSIAVDRSSVQRIEQQRLDVTQRPPF